MYLKKQSLNDKQQQTLNKAKFVRAVEFLELGFK